MSSHIDLVKAARDHAKKAHECLEEADRHVANHWKAGFDGEAVDRAIAKATAHALTALALRGT